MRSSLLAAMVIASIEGGPVAALSPPADEVVASVDLAGNLTIAHLLDLCAEELGITVEYDASMLSGEVTLRHGDSLTRNGLWSMVNRVLAGKGMTTIRFPGSAVLSVARLEDAAKVARIEPGPWIDNEGEVSAASEYEAGFVRVVLQTRGFKAATLAPRLEPLLTQPGGELDELSTDTILVSDLSPRVRELARLIDELDGAARSPVIVRVPVFHVSAERLATEITVASQNLAAMDGRERRGRVQAAEDGASIILTAPPAEVDDWQAFVRAFDTKQDVLRRTYVLGPSYGLDEVVLLIEQTGKDGSPGGSGEQWAAVPNQLAGTIIVTATAAEHDRIQELLGELDRAPAELRLRMQSFPLVHRRVDDIQPVLAELLDVVTMSNARPADDGALSADDMSETPVAVEPGRPLSAPAPPPLTISADEETNTLIAVGAPRYLDQLAAVLAELDVRQPQVMVEALLVSLTESDTRDLGIELDKLATSGDTMLRFASLFGLGPLNAGSTAANVAGAGFTGAALSPGDFSVLVRALETLNEGRALNMPKVLVANNADATLDSVLQQPTTTLSTTNTDTTIASFGQFEDAGTSITVTPRIGAGDSLELAYTVNLSTFVGESSSPSIPPPRQQNTLASEVVIPDGYTVVVGGLEVVSDADALQKVPLLGDLPGVGVLFQSRSRSTNRSRFYVFIRATILRQRDFADLKYISDQDYIAVELEDAGSPLAIPASIPRVIK